MLLTLSKITGKTLAVLLMMILTLYLILLLINLSDEAPSADAITLQQLQHAAKPDVGQLAENGYAYLLQHDKPTEYRLKEPLSALMHQCLSDDCHTALQAQTDLALLIKDHQAIADFYQQIRGFPHWYEVIPANAAEALPSFSSLLNGQQLLLVQAWLAVQQQDMTTAQQLLQQDLQFWRSVLANNNLLITKMVTTAAIKRHFNVASTIKQQLTPELHSAMLPDIWLTPFSTEELTLLQALSGEWVYGNNIAAALFSRAPELSVSTETEYLAVMLLRPLFQQQASSNQRASQLLASVNNQSVANVPWYSWLYNPLGKLVNSIGPLDYTSYQQRLLELETLRQQAVSPALIKTAA
jgi:hypothetical protein